MYWVDSNGNIGTKSDFDMSGRLRTIWTKEQSMENENVKQPKENSEKEIMVTLIWHGIIGRSRKMWKRDVEERAQ